MGKLRAYVSVTNDLYTDNRVHKVCEFLTKQGYSVTLVGRLRRNSMPLNQRSYQTHRMRLLVEKGALFYASYNLRLFLYLLVRRADLLVANDLDTLLANTCAGFFKPTTRLVYDTHEYFTEVPELVARPKIQRIWVRLEKFLFPKLESVYTVNASIAAIYQEKYQKKIEVVRNCSTIWKPSLIKSKKELGIPENQFIIIIQGAGINVDRGAEEAIEAIKSIKNCCLLIVGDGDAVPMLQLIVKDYDLQDKVLFFGKRPYTEMMQFTYHADLGLTLDKPTNSNYLYSLPNKVFDYIQAGTPFLCSDLVEVKRVAEQHGVGWVIPEVTPSLIAKQINFILDNPAELAAKKQNCLRAAETENWEHEENVLRTIYPACHA